MGVVAGVLLTGGRSRRLGLDKLSLSTADGVSLAERTALLLRGVAEPVFEVGRGLTSIASIQEVSGEGPMAAIAAFVRHLGDLPAATLVVAADLPLLTEQVLSVLAAHPATDAVVPMCAGFPQVLCARYPSAVLLDATSAYDAGERSLRRVLARHPVQAVSGLCAALRDLDTLDDLDDMARLGLLVNPDQ